MFILHYCYDFLKSPTEDDVTTRFDAVFWLGDLNFRIQKERDRISKKLKAIESQDIPCYDDLMTYDELFIARNEGIYHKLPFTLAAQVSILIVVCMVSTIIFCKPFAL